MNGAISLAELHITFHDAVISDIYAMKTFSLFFFSEVSEEDLEMHTKLFDIQ